MDCSYCRGYGDGELHNPDGTNIERGHDLCSECYKKWKESKMKDHCPMCYYEMIRHMGRSLGKPWMIMMIRNFKKDYNL